MESLLVTGSQGFIGQNLINNKEINKYNYFCTVRKKEYKKKKNINHKFIQINLLNKKLYKKLPNICDQIIHLAGDARTFVNKKNERKQIYENTKITKNLIKYAISSKCKKFIFLSSVYVYSGNNEKVYKENLNLCPSESLGKSKLICEKLICNYAKKYKVECYILRAFTIYGSNSRKTQFLPMIKRKINHVNCKNITLKKPHIIRDFLHVDDLLNAIFLCLKVKNKKKINILNIGSGKSISIGLIVKKLIDISNKKVKLVFLPLIKSQEEIGDKNHNANIEKIKKILNWRPKINIKKGLKKFYEQN